MRRYRYRMDDETKTEGYQFKHYGRNRYICDVLEEMRKLVEHGNVSPLRGLIEEAQSLANRMESGLSDKRDLLGLSEETAKARRAYKALQREYEKLEEKVKSLKTIVSKSETSKEAKKV